MKMNKTAEKRCIHCGRIIVDENSKTRLCPKCTKKGVTATAVAAAVVPVAVTGVKKYSKKIFQFAKLVIKH